MCCCQFVIFSFAKRTGLLGLIGIGHCCAGKILYTWNQPPKGCWIGINCVTNQKRNQNGGIILRVQIQCKHASMELQGFCICNLSTCMHVDRFFCSVKVHLRLDSLFLNCKNDLRGGIWWTFSQPFGRKTLMIRQAESYGLVRWWIPRASKQFTVYAPGAQH